MEELRFQKWSLKVLQQILSNTSSSLVHLALPYCYYYKRVLILANIGDLVLTAKFCARYLKIMSSITMNIIKIEQLISK